MDPSAGYFDLICRITGLFAGILKRIIYSVKSPRWHPTRIIVGKLIPNGIPVLTYEQ
jgi:hypothetical protein